MIELQHLSSNIISKLHSSAEEALRLHYADMCVALRCVHSSTEPNIFFEWFCSVIPDYNSLKLL